MLDICIYACLHFSDTCNNLHAWMRFSYQPRKENNPTPDNWSKHFAVDETIIQLQARSSFTAVMGADENKTRIKNPALWNYNKYFSCGTVGCCSRDGFECNTTKYSMKDWNVSEKLNKVAVAWNSPNVFHIHSVGTQESRTGWNNAHFKSEGKEVSPY